MGKRRVWTGNVVSKKFKPKIAIMPTTYVLVEK